MLYCDDLLSESEKKMAKHQESMASEAATTDKIAVVVAPFTGGPFSVQVSRKDTVEDFKKVVAKRLKVLKDRICLLYRDRYVIFGTNSTVFL